MHPDGDGVIDEKNAGRTTNEYGDRTVDTSSDEKRKLTGDGFWDIGSPPKKAYRPQNFAPDRLEPQSVNGSDDNPAEKDESARGAERVPTWEEYLRAKGKLDDAKSPASPHSPAYNPAPRVIANSYKRPRRIPPRSDFGLPPQSGTKRRGEKEPERVIETPSGALIKKITVMPWISENTFYARFARDAEKCYGELPAVPYTESIRRVGYTSFVPQYAHMTAAQLENYRWIRENIRNGVCPDCDMSYILLFIYEVINLTGGVIEPERGQRLLLEVWRGYRGRYAGLDGWMCEWYIDYCITNSVKPLTADPNSGAEELIAAVLPNTQFKEYYFDELLSAGKFYSAALALYRTSSDYSYKSARYYKDNAEAYDRHIIAALAAVLEEEMRSERGLFDMDRRYKLIRDGFIGAVASSAVKKRIELEFCSFTRKAESREMVTCLVKYTENRLRAVLGIKAKLGVKDGAVSAADMSVIDSYFAPMMPAPVKKLSAEDRYMPADYLKNYEAEQSGFDLDSAAAIERESWSNTARLVDDVTDNSADSQADAEEMPEGGIPASSPEQVPPDDAEAIPGEITFASAEYTSPENGKESGIPHPAEETAADGTLIHAVEAALAGGDGFKKYAKEVGIFEGELSDRVNRVFLEEIGDVLIEDNKLIEDYREDAEEWIKRQRGM